MIAADLPDPSGKAKVDALAQKLRSEPGVAFVAPTRINEQGDAALLTVIPKGSPQDAASRTWSTGCARTSCRRRSAAPASTPRSAA